MREDRHENERAGGEEERESRGAAERGRAGRCESASDDVRKHES